MDKHKPNKNINTVWAWLLESSINGCETATAIILQSKNPLQHHNIVSRADLTFSSLYSVSPRLTMPKFLSTTEGLINYSIRGQGHDVSAELMDRGKILLREKNLWDTVMYWNCVLANWPWKRGRQNSMETVNNRLMGMALIDKASASEARACGHGAWAHRMNRKYQVTSHHEPFFLTVAVVSLSILISSAFGLDTAAFQLNQLKSGNVGLFFTACKRLLSLTFLFKIL